MPAQAGLYSAILGLTLYALFATSRHLKITTSSTMSIMSIAVVAPLAGGDAASFMALTSALAIMVGIILIVLSFMKLGYIFGVPGGSGTFFQQLGQFIANLPQTNLMRWH